MSPAQRRYLRIEATIAAAINAALSVAFVYLMFGGDVVVPVAGADGLIVDALPQSFMVAAMSTLVPTLLTRRRLATGAVTPLSPPRSRRLPRHVVARAAIVGLGVAILAGILHAVLLPMTGPAWRFSAVLAFKSVYGAMLGAVIAWFAARIALAD